ncbi:MAG: transglutaminase family protein [Bryobacteraceae bacterium]
MLYQATHTTRYLYDEPVAQCLSEARLTPRAIPGQILHQTRLHVEPEPAMLESRKDYFGNDVTTFAVFRMHETFSATATSIVEVTPRPIEASAEVLKPELPWEAARNLLSEHPDADTLDAYEFIFDSPFVAAAPELADYAKPTFPKGRPLVDAVAELSHRIYKEFHYEPKSTSIDMPLLEVLEIRRGVCQDFAHVMIGALRSLRLSARYVSGYLKSGTTYQGADASHAWVSVFIPGAGWLDFDPTNDCRPKDGHVTLSWGRDYGDVTPVKGIALGGGEQIVEVAVRVDPVSSPPPA